MKMRKKWLPILMVLILIANLFPVNQVVEASESHLLNLSNPNASQYTKELFAYLKGLGDDEILFGQQHATDEGLTLSGEGNLVGSTESEVKNAVGDHPAIFGWDTNSLDGRERPGNAIDDVVLSQEQRTRNLADSMIAAHKLGGIVTLSMHPNNFVTGGSYGDTSGNVVREILPGGSKHDEFNQWLNNLVKLSYLVVDDNGQAIPIIFRPFHEQTGGWFWWGATTTSPEQYKAIFRYTVEYLHEHGNNNFLIAFSPGAGSAGDLERYLGTYPGDDYVDILGIDKYDEKNNAGSKAWINAMAADLSMMAQEAEARGKISAFTEFGYSAEGMNKEGNNLEWWTTVLDGIMNHPDYPDAAKTSYMLTWANFGWPNNMFVPYKDINGDLGGDHELLPNFTEFFEDERTLFTEQVVDVYGTGNQYEVAPHDPFMYLVSPTNGDRIVSSPLEFKARVVNGVDPSVTYSVDGGDEVDMELDGQYYQASWSPTAEYNESAVDVTVRYYEDDQLINEQTHRYYIFLSDVLIEELTFVGGIGGIKSNGTWPEDGVDFSLSHAQLNGKDMLELSTSGMSAEETWQELKLELTQLDDVNLGLVNQLRLDGYVPVSVGEGNLNAVVQLPDNWDDKYEASVVLSSLEIVTIDGTDYYQYQATVNFPHAVDARSVAVSLVGMQLQLDEPIYVERIQLLNSYIPAPEDPFLVDNFEGYMGDDALLDNAYGSNGDPIELTLSNENKYAGDYGMQYDFTIGSSGYSGREINFGPVDWMGANAISFWMKHDGHPGLHLTLQINIGGVAFESDVDLDEAYEGIVELPLVDFAPAHWEGNQDAIVDRNRIGRVSSFAFYMGREDDENHEGTIYFDEIRAIESDDAPNIPDAEESGPAEPIVYDFEEELAGWDGPGATIEDGHLRVDISSDATKNEGKTEVKKTSGYDLSDYNYIVARVKVDASLSAKMFIKTGSDWAWSDSGEVELGADGYTEMIFDISEIDGKENVQEIGFEFLAGKLENDIEALIDSIQIVNDLDDLISGEDTENPVDPEIPEEDLIKELENKILGLTKRIEELEAMGVDLSELNRLLAKLKAEIEALELNDDDLSAKVMELLARIEALEAQVAERENEQGVNVPADEDSNNDPAGNAEDDQSGATEENGTTDGKGDPLPSTATALYNYLLIGALILAIGASLARYSYKRKNA